MRCFSSASAVIIPALAALLVSASCAAVEEPVQPPNKFTDTEHMELGITKTAKDNPEQIAKAIAKMQAALKHDPNVPSIGNPNADVTIVEFLDYHCGHAKMFMSPLLRLVKDDSNLRIVFIEFPILGDDSVLAAKAALAINKIDKTKYIAYHRTLMKSRGKFTMELLTKMTKPAGIDKKAFGHVMEEDDAKFAKTIDANAELAHSLNIHETPALVVGNKVIHGMIDEDVLGTEVAALHKKG
jgi:protein-disulfide isomerase